MSARWTIEVGLGARSYEVVVGAGLLEACGPRLAALKPKARAVVVTDETVARLHLEALERSLVGAGVRADTITLAPGEASKRFAILETTLERMAGLGLGRGDVVVAFGGGVIGDLAGLAAGLFMRGIDFVQVPTTLLAQVDSSVGGKTAIDSRHGKNLFGLFHQPRLVLADLDVLATLPSEERRAGYAEIVKIALAQDAAFFDWLESHGAAVLRLEPEALGEAVARAVRLKAAIVAADERESGPRALLNLGHTFGHALEIASGYHPALLHGLAVACGTGLAVDVSERLGLMAGAEAERVRAHLTVSGFELRPNRLPGAPFTPDQLIQAMAHDKKTESGRLTFVLLRGVGRGEIVKDAPLEAVANALKEALSRP